MTADAFTEAACKAGPKDWPAANAAFVDGAEWARAHLAAQDLAVNIQREEGKPATCEVRQGGVLIFSGRDHIADVQITAQEPTDAEIEAALTALLISESIALGQTADEAADYAIRELETRDLTNLRTGVRCALRSARAARRDEEKR